MQVQVRVAFRLQQVIIVILDISLCLETTSISLCLARNGAVNRENNRRQSGTLYRCIVDQ